ncbi:uncharacterized protein LOC143891063 [Tasmannia lanceolata]|uniref:uncharacterized protein LOC143891063 n=1 Tax=Tasmannia lanceolata TaxID=3420 RepID=UPI00406440EE
MNATLAAWVEEEEEPEPSILIDPGHSLPFSKSNEKKVSSAFERKSRNSSLCFSTDAQNPFSPSISPVKIRQKKVDRRSFFSPGNLHKLIQSFKNKEPIVAVKSLISAGFPPPTKKQTPAVLLPDLSTLARSANQIQVLRFRETRLMASSRNSSSSRCGIRIATRNCKCEKKASIQITKTDENGNRGRLFYACAFFCEGSTKKCNYFRWCKEDMDDNEVGSNRDDIAELKNEIAELKNDMGTLVNLLYE